MPDWLREHIGEIALLIYIVYPLLKRWRDRRKQRREEAQTQEQTQRQEQRQQRHRGRGRVRDREPDRDRSEDLRPTEADYIDAARARLDRLEQAASRLLERADSDLRLVRLAPTIRDDLLRRIAMVKRSVSGTPTLSTIVQETTVIAGLEELLRYLSTMARQRTTGQGSLLADADAVADALYAPLLELARVQGLDLRTSQPVAIMGDWTLSIVPRFASTRVAPLRLPRDFEQDVFRWPAIAHEVAHDFYYSLESMDESLRARLALPAGVPVLESGREVDEGWLRELFGAWLPEIFADTLGTIMLGPAYVEAMRRAFRNPSSPQRTAAIMQDGSTIDEHPPERLRLYMACRVLHHLGRHEEANMAWERWEADHPDVRFYYLPLGGAWIGLSDEHLHDVADSLVDLLLLRPWPELEGFQLQNIPGLAYLHGEHATVERLVENLAHGTQVEADPRWIVAAAVLATAARPTLHERILDAARQSIRGIGEVRAPAAGPAKAPRAPARTIRAELVSSLTRPEAIREAIVLGAILGPAAPRKPPSSRQQPARSARR